MITEKYCREILEQYPEYITKDQMYRICHISKKTRRFKIKTMKNYPDVLNVRQVVQFTGYGESSVAKWCSKQELKSFLIRQKFKIPKEYLLDFFVSRYFIGIAVKSEKHQKFNEKIRKLCEVSSEE